MAPPNTWEKDLHGFLARAFTAEELRILVYYNLRPLYPSIQGGSGIEIAHEIVAGGNRNGLLDDNFFTALTEQRDKLMTEIAAIQDAWRAATKPGSRPSTTTAPSTTTNISNSTGDPSHAAIVLDRVAQWDDLLAECASCPQHLIFLVHGDFEQDLDLFLARIRRYLGVECSRQHLVYPVSRSTEHSTALTGSDWARQVIAASPTNATLQDALYQGARRRNALYIFEEYGHPLTRLKWSDLDGIISFFREQAAGAIAETPPPHALRFVLPVQHREDSKAIRELLKKTQARLAGLAGFKTLPLKELTFPTLKDVKKHVTDLLGDLGPTTIAEIEALHRHVTDRTRNHERSLRGLGDPLQKLIDTELQRRRVGGHGQPRFG